MLFFAKFWFSSIKSIMFNFFEKVLFHYRKSVRYVRWEIQKKKFCFRIKITFFFRNFSQNNRKLRFISNLQSIKNRWLFKIRKIQNRKIWINTYLRNQFALFSTKTCLKSRSKYYTKCLMFSASTWSFLSRFLFSFSYFFVFFSIFFLFSHSLRLFQLQKRIVLTFINKSCRSLIVLLNFSLRNEIEKKRKINCSNIQSSNIKNSNFRIFTFKITYKIKKKSTIVVFDRFVYFICIIKTRFLHYFRFYHINQNMFSYMFQL